MLKLAIYDGSEGVRFFVHLATKAKADGTLPISGKNAVRIYVNGSAGTFNGKEFRHASDMAIAKALHHERAPESAFAAVYLVNPAPYAAGRFGAPLGRMGSGVIDPDQGRLIRAKLLPLDSGGYDKGGAYWGHGTPLYAVQDGLGNLAYIRANSNAEAIKQACEG